MDSLHILDRPDGARKQEAFNAVHDRLVEEAKREQLSPPAFLDKARKAYRALCEADTQIEFKPGIRGALRSYGRRKIGDVSWETVHASHTCVFGNEIEQALAAMSGYPPRAYYGLSVGLPEVYRSMCTRYDELAAGMGDLDQKLLAEAFLQLVGTRVLHPFWDGNGRTFGAHLVLLLEREGIRIREFGEVQAITAALTDINDSFLRKVLADADLPLISNEYHFWIVLDAAFREEYMDRLRTAIENAIVQGIDPAGSSFKYFSDAAWAIKMFLVRRKLWVLGEAEAQRLAEEIDSKGAAQIAQIPVGHREYFARKFREYYTEHEMKGRLFLLSLQSLGKYCQEIHDEGPYAMLRQLMEHYERSRVDATMAYEFVGILEKDRSTAERAAQEFGKPEVVEALTAWPGGNDNVFVRDLFVHDIWSLEEKGNVDPSVISIIAKASQSEAVRQLYNTCKDDGNLHFRIGILVASVAGYTKDEKLAGQAAESLQPYGGKQDIVHGIGMLEELAEFTRDRETVEHAIAILRIFARRTDAKKYHLFCRTIEQAIAERKGHDRAMVVADFREGLREERRRLEAKNLL